MARFLHLLLALVCLLVSSVLADVTYDGRSLIMNGERKILFSGSIHYPRSTPDMWPSLISKAKRGGLDVIQTYVFWNLHEPQPGQYDFSGRRDLVRFIKEVGAQGLYVSLRVGPFIQSEWAYGGFPFWLHDVPNIVFRSDNEPFKAHMHKFTSMIVNLMKAENLYASQGGPIIVSQIENEYGTIEAAYRTRGPAYVQWAASMAVGLQTGVPWMMCKQPNAPDPVINTCNGMRCGQTFQGPNSPNKPSMWTENWTSFYQVYGTGPYIRSAEEIAFQVALFIAKNGSFVNYYMYHGGTNFGRMAAAYFITSYYDQAPLDEYGLLRQPKWGHLKDLHEAIRICSGTLLSGTASEYTLGQQQKAYVFAGEPGKCAAFLLNENNSQEVRVQFTNLQYVLPPHSISILPDCKTVAFNTAQVKAPVSKRFMVKSIVFDSDDEWKQFKDEVPTYDGTLLKSNTVLDQMSMTKDTSDYLWYTFSFKNSIPDNNATLSVGSRSHVLHAFVNGEMAGSAHGSRNSSTFSLVKRISLKAGTNNISLLSVMVGLPDSGAYLERRVAGLRRVRIFSNSKTRDFTHYAWGYQVGLKGEKLRAYSEESANKVGWGDFISDNQPLKWYKTTFNTPKGNTPLTLNLASMRKGEAWVNGQSIGRYWVAFRTSEGFPSQSRYNIPRSFLKPTGNSLVILEEETGKPRRISIDIVLVRYASSSPSNRYIGI